NVLLLGLFLFIYAIVKKFSVLFSWQVILLFVLSGLLTTGLGRFTFFSSIKLIDPSRASGIKNAAPIFTTLFALLILWKKLGTCASFGLLVLLRALVIQGAIFFYNAKKKTRIIRNKVIKNGWVIH